MLSLPTAAGGLARVGASWQFPACRATPNRRLCCRCVAGIDAGGRGCIRTCSIVMVMAWMLFCFTASASRSWSHLPFKSACFRCRKSIAAAGDFSM